MACGLSLPCAHARTDSYSRAAAWQRGAWRADRRQPQLQQRHVTFTRSPALLAGAAGAAMRLARRGWRLARLAGAAQRGGLQAWGSERSGRGRGRARAWLQAACAHGERSSRSSGDATVAGTVAGTVTHRQARLGRRRGMGRRARRVHRVRLQTQARRGKEKEKETEGKDEIAAAARSRNMFRELSLSVFTQVRSRSSQHRTASTRAGPI